LSLALRLLTSFSNLVSREGKACRRITFMEGAQATIMARWLWGRFSAVLEWRW
jgi:hypothetical protein